MAATPGFLFRSAFVLPSTVQPLTRSWQTRTWRLFDSLFLGYLNT